VTRYTIGMGSSKHVFSCMGECGRRAVLRRSCGARKWWHSPELAATLIGIEACGGSHHWARLLSSFGHEVRLIAPQLVNPYVKRGKNDAADA